MMRSDTVDPPVWSLPVADWCSPRFASASAEALNSGVYRRNLFRLAAQEYIGDSRPQAFFFR